MKMSIDQRLLRLSKVFEKLGDSPAASTAYSNYKFSDLRSLITRGKDAISKLLKNKDSSFHVNSLKFFEPYIKISKGNTVLVIPYKTDAKEDTYNIQL